MLVFYDTFKKIRNWEIQFCSAAYHRIARFKCDFRSDNDSCLGWRPWSASLAFTDWADHIKSKNYLSIQ